MRSQHTLGKEGEGFFMRLPAPLENEQAFITARNPVTDAGGAGSRGRDGTKETTQLVRP